MSETCRLRRVKRCGAYDDEGRGGATKRVSFNACVKASVAESATTKMARKRAVAPGKHAIEWDAGSPNPKQQQFFKSRALYTAYGGAKGGGKTWAVRTKAVGGALFNAGIRILIMRRTYPELEENHIRPIVRMVPAELAGYNGTTHVMSFYNGSTIKFGHWSGEVSEQEYQGLEFDWIFMDEATQFTERAFNYLGGCLRGVNDFPKRMYLTCNPGGITFI